MNDATPIIRTGRKFEQVLEGARQVFMTDGFEGANVDDIAKKAGVSKATLYSYFPDKRLLFMEVVNQECERQSQSAIDNIDQSAPPRDVLTQAGQHFLRFLTSQFGQQVSGSAWRNRIAFQRLAVRFMALVRNECGSRWWDISPNRLRVVN